MGVKWLILSAKYGLIEPDFLIPENYDVTIKTKAQKDALVRLVADQIREKRLYEYSEIYSLCGKRYDEILEEAFKSFGCIIKKPFSKRCEVYWKKNGMD